MLTLSTARLRTLERAGIVRPQSGPRGALRLGFRDLVMIRLMSGLMRSGISSRRVIRSLTRLQRRLPAGQSLTQLIELDELPRNGTGVDRRALHDPAAPVARIVPPRTTVEKAVARVWQDALGVDAVGLTDNFFDLGGHSLLSARIIVQLDRKFGIRLNQATMALGTLEQIARDIERRLEDHAS